MRRPHVVVVVDVLLSPYTMAIRMVATASPILFGLLFGVAVVVIPSSCTSTSAVPVVIAVFLPRATTLPSFLVVNRFHLVVSGRAPVVKAKSSSYLRHQQEDNERDKLL